ncbi:hypothetical protein BKA69DRAFT_1120925 [Paraphysoderma sedebokerense]|nr:hypothetical protein BKA69DRAFT_1120925 [Paraphysoderma sedebokerense]
MTLFTSVAGWATFGFLARAMANGIEKRHPLSGMKGHLGTMTVFGLFGYWVHGVQQRHAAELERHIGMLREKKRLQAESS